MAIHTLPAPDELWEAYQRERSVRRVGVLFGVSGDTIHQRLIKAGYRLPSAAWSDDDLSILREWYATHDTKGSFNLDALASRLGRLKSNVSRKARELGLTDGARKAPEYAQGMSDYRAAHEHPRGMKGKSHAPETKAAIGARSREQAARTTPAQWRRRGEKTVATNLARYGVGSPGLRNTSNPHSRTKGGKREDLGGQFYRSAWEANYARYLQFLKERGEIADWRYEPRTFVFHGITRGVISYTPDFQVFERDGSYAWHEVKGWMDAKSKAKLKRMAKFYPDEKVIVIAQKEYKAIAEYAPLIAGWE